MDERKEETGYVENLGPEQNEKGKGWVIISILLAVLFVFLAVYSVYQYNTIKKNKAEIQSLQEMNLTGENEQKKLNTYISEITETIDSVESKLSDIRQKQVAIKGMLSNAKGERSQKERAFDDIAAIENQLQQDKKDLQGLRDKMRKSNIRIKLLDEMVANLQGEIEKSEKSIAELRSVIDEKNFVIQVKEDSLSASKENLKQIKNELELTSQILDETRNTAYFVKDTKKNLLENNILEESGLIRKKLSLAKDFNTDSFDKINITTDDSFDITGKAKDIKILPPRAETSYKIEDTGNGSMLTVVNPEQFWKIRYLVVVEKN